MRYLIHDGGNLLQLPWSVQTSGRVGDYRVNYAEHHKRRTLEIEKHIDTQSSVWNGFDFAINGEAADKPIVLVTGDELATHIFGTGSLIDYIVFHVKRAGSGTIEPFIEQDDGTRLAVTAVDGSNLKIDLSKTGHYYGMVPAQATGAAGTGGTKATGETGAAGDGTTTVTAIVPSVTISNVTFAVQNAAGTAAGTATGDVVVPQRTVSVDVPRGAAAEGAGAGKPVPFMTTDNGVIGFAFTAKKDDAGVDMAFDTCMGIYMAVKDFWDEHECECAPAPCETKYPDAVCAPHKKPSGSTSSTGSTGSTGS